MTGKRQVECPRCGDRFDEVGPEGYTCYRCKRTYPREPVQPHKATEPRPYIATVTSSACVVKVSDVPRKEVRWLWEGRIAHGRLTCLMGDPGVAKSWLSLSIAAAVSRGARLPGQTTANEPANVLLLSAEDGISDTIKARLEDMGAAQDRIHVLTATLGKDGRQRHPSLVDDLGAIESVLAAGGYSLLVIDPINAYLGTSLDTHRDAALRGVLSPLAALCERLGIACLFILHLTKSGRDRAIYRGQGSIGYTAAARVVLLAGQMPDDPAKRALVWVKGNLSPPAPSLAYEIADGRFIWNGETDVSASALLAPEPSDDQRFALANAKGFLLEALSAGPVPVKEIRTQAINAGITEATLRRAKLALNIKAYREGGLGRDGRWVWSLPKTLIPSNMSNLSMLGDSTLETGADRPGK